MAWDGVFVHERRKGFHVLACALAVRTFIHASLQVFKVDLIEGVKGNVGEVLLRAAVTVESTLRLAEGHVFIFPSGVHCFKGWSNNRLFCFSQTFTSLQGISLSGETTLCPFYRDLLFFEPYSFEIWLYLEKGIEVAKYVNLPEIYFKAYSYKELYGSYPTLKELESIADTLPDSYVSLSPYYQMYESEFYSGAHTTGFYTDVYLVSDADYITLSKRHGENHRSAEEDLYYYYEEDLDENAIPQNSVYTVIHSTNPEKTEAWLKAAFPDFVPASNNREANVLRRMWNPRPLSLKICSMAFPHAEV